ncbi:PoNe immunity protein domain-containing protein [Pedobacter petrophilus]|nr:PoNe immunity protein domain-containing protein [Pedobacter petrophilus]
MTTVHFENRISSRTNHIKEYEAELKDFDDLSRPYYTLYMDNLKLLTSKYSAGYNIQELKDNVAQAINWLIKNIEHPEHDKFYLDNLEDYLNLLQLLSLGFLFNINKTVLKNLLNLFEADDKKDGDALLDKIVIFIEPDRPQDNKLQHPKAYQSLFDAINAAKKEQPKLMQNFLKGWYKSMRKCGWHDIHTSQGKSNFNGYWCWESAMVTILCDIDDSSYRDMPFYPKDIVDYARQNKQYLKWQILIK